MLRLRAAVPGERVVEDDDRDEAEGEHPHVVARGQAGQEADCDVRREQACAGGEVVQQVRAQAAGTDEREHRRDEEPVHEREDEHAGGDRGDRRPCSGRAAAERRDGQHGERRGKRHRADVEERLHRLAPAHDAPEHEAHGHRGHHRRTGLEEGERDDVGLLVRRRLALPALPLEPRREEVLEPDQAPPLQ